MLRITKGFLVSILIVVISLSLVGCSEHSDSENSEAMTESTDLVIATAGTAGAWYPIGTGMAEIITELDNNIFASAEVTNGGIENARLVGKNESQIGFINNDAAYWAYEGSTPYEDKLDVLGIASLYPSTMQIAVLDDSGITSIEELRGKRVVVGPPASSSAIMSWNVLAEYGITEEDITGLTLSFAEGAEAMKDGHADALIVVSAHPNSAITELGVTKAVRLLPISKQIQDKVAEKYPYYGAFTIPAGTYSSINEDTPTLSLGTMLIANKDVPEEVVYQFTKGIYENLDRLGEVHAMAKQISVEYATSIPIPFHPGAEKYFNEQGLLN